MAPKGSALRSRSSSTSSRNRGSVANASAKSSRTSAKSRSRSSKTGTTSEASARENDEGVQMAKAATRLQALVRGFLARRSFSGREVVPMADKGAWFTIVADDAEARKAAEREMEEAVHAAEVMAFRAEMRQAEVKRQQELEKWRQKRELEKQTAKFVAAAFDGDVDQVKALLSWGVPIDGRSHCTTGLSEAACAGVSEIVRLLLGLRADPNIQGEFADQLDATSDKETAQVAKQTEFGEKPAPLRDVGSRFRPARPSSRSANLSHSSGATERTQ